MAKRDYHLILEETVMKQFKVYIMRKTHDFKKGDLSKWVETELKNTIREDKQQQHTTYGIQTVSKDEGMISTLTDLMKAVKSFLWNDPDKPLDITCGNTCHKDILKNTISKVKNVNDYRSTKKWFDRLIEFSFIRRSKGDTYRIVNDGHDAVSLEQEKKDQINKEIDDTVRGYK
jgi:hypothetical protein